MQPEAPAMPAATLLLERIPAHWRAPLVRLAVVWLGLMALFLGDWSDMAWQWWDSSTYNHILLIPPILVWLVLQRKAETARLVPSAWWPGLIVVGGAMLLWVLGEFSGLNLARQLAVVVMLQGAALSLLGISAARARELFGRLRLAWGLLPLGAKDD